MPRNPRYGRAEAALIASEVKRLRRHLIDQHPERNAHLTNDLGVLIGLHSRAHQENAR